MSREIKFRVWSPHRKKMIYPEDSSRGGDEGYVKDLYYHCVHHTQGVIFEMTLNGRVFESECCGFKGFVDKDVLQQYTALKDKNGKEIYEGDIIKEEWDAPVGHLVNIYQIKFGEYKNSDGFLSNGFYGAALIAEDKWLDGSDYGCGIRSTNERWEVIGNIFENPELLK